MDRARLLDMEKRIKPVRRRAMTVLAVALVVAAPWIGLWTLLPLVFAGIIFELAERNLEESERPEYVMFFVWAGAELTIAACVLIVGAPFTATLAWLAIPVVTLHSRFSARGVYLGVAIAVALVLAVAAIGDLRGVLDDPVVVFAPIALILAIAILSTALMRSDIEHRGEAVIDQLTGMLNRHALENRVYELAQQSEYTGQPVALIMGDLDHFKDVNDSRGHTAGDAVLKDVAYLMRKRLRAFDLSYRIGGEEFLVVLAGADAEEARGIAEDLRRMLEETTLGDGVSMTMSFGVSASAKGTRFDFEEIFGAADDALYEAKDGGRNRVCVIEPDGDRPAEGTPAAHSLALS
jgi:diguanylate cyclase (GGDEF)-like protein